MTINIFATATAIGKNKKRSKDQDESEMTKAKNGSRVDAALYRVIMMCG